MPAALISREEVIERILAVFHKYGYEGASLARLSEATGLGRSSLYHYFPNGKQDMAAAGLAAVGAWFDEHVMAALEGPGTPRSRLRRFAGKLAEFYRDGSKACLMDLFCIGEAGEVFQRQLGKRMQAMIRALARVVAESGVAPAEAARRAENALIAVQGSLVVSRVLGNRTPFQRVIEQLPDDLLRG